LTRIRLITLLEKKGGYYILIYNIIIIKLHKFVGIVLKRFSEQQGDHAFLRTPFEDERLVVVSLPNCASIQQQKEYPQP